VEIVVGIKHVARELAIQSIQNAEDLRATVAAAVSGTEPVLALTDEHDRLTLIPSDSIGYVQIGPEGGRRVGFGSA
jgi:hypothetical protein